MHVSPVTQGTPEQLHNPLVVSQATLVVLLFSLQSLRSLQAHFPARQTLFLCEPQLFPQPPQFAVFVETSVSQPLSTPVVGFEQLPNPGAQKEVHAFPVHTAVATFVDEHARLHPPQLAMSS